jgi:hypothetical protein
MTLAPHPRLRVLKMGLWSLLVLLATPLRSQEIEGNGKDGSSLFSPTDYIDVSTPLTERIGLNAYGFYLGNVQTRIGLVEVPFKVWTHL